MRAKIYVTDDSPRAEISYSGACAESTEEVYVQCKARAGEESYRSCSGEVYDMNRYASSDSFSPEESCHGARSAHECWAGSAGVDDDFIGAEAASQSIVSMEESW